MAHSFITVGNHLPHTVHKNAPENKGFEQPLTLKRQAQTLPPSHHLASQRKIPRPTPWSYPLG